MWRITYIYSATGEKLAKKMKDGTYQYYCGNMVYKNDKSLNYLLFDEGLVTKTSSVYSFDYHLKDHLGNTRVTFQPNGSATTTTQVAEYYPFGSSYLPVSPAGTNKYLYNGKEKQDDVLSGTALDWYDYGARFYDPQIGRWHTIDPLTELKPGISPYTYCYNNPSRYIDLLGLEGNDTSSGGKEMWGRDRFDSFSGMYISPMDRPGGATTSGYGDPQNGHYENKYEAHCNGYNYMIEDEGNIEKYYFRYSIDYAGQEFVWDSPENRMYGRPNASGGVANAWDYISNGASVASGYPTISGTWAYNTSGDVAWTGKNGNYYKLSQVKNNGGYVKSMNYAKNASRLTRGLGNGLAGLSIVTSLGSVGVNLYNGTDNTSVWVGAAIGIGTGILTFVAAPVVTGAVIVGATWGVGQLLLEMKLMVG